MKKIAITEEDAWKKLEDLYLSLEKDLLVEVVLEFLHEAIKETSRVKEETYEKVLNCELDMEFGDDKYLVIPNTRTTRILYGKGSNEQK